MRHGGDHIHCDLYDQKQMKFRAARVGFLFGLTAGSIFARMIHDLFFTAGVPLFPEPGPGAFRINRAEISGFPFAVESQSEDTHIASN